MWLLLALACSERAMLTFPVHAAPTPAHGPWALDRAEVTFSDLRLHGPDETARRGLMPTAVAHPGHDRDGGVTAELGGTFSLDLLSEPVRLGDASAWEGGVETGTLTLHDVALEGTVDGRPFAFDLAPETDIAGLAVPGLLDADAPPRLVLTVDPGAFLAFADPDTDDTDADGLLTGADGDLENTVRFGVLSVDAWRLDLETP